MGKDIDPDTHRDRPLNPAIAVFRSKARAKIAIHDLYNVIGDSRFEMDPIIYRPDADVFSRQGGGLNATGIHSFQ